MLEDRLVVDIGWPWLNQNAWVASALMVVAFAGAAATMAWHIVEIRSTRYTYLVVAGLLLFALSFVLVGVSVGEKPILPTRNLIPMIRILWLVSAILLNTFLLVYWATRIKIRKHGEMENK